MRKICDKKEKIHKEGQKSPLEPGRASGAGGWRGPRRVGRAGGERVAPERGGLPMGSPTGRQTRRGKADAPQRRGLPGVKRRVSTSQAEAAPAVTEGQHESSGDCARRGSARVKRRPRPPWVSTSGAEAEPAVGQRRSSEWFPPILPKRRRHGKGLRCFHAKTAPGGSLPRGWCGDFVSGYRICRYSFPAP